jgi:hypothetical protein
MTMKLEDQVTSLELSMKLKELGVKQESLFYWFDTRNTGDLPKWYLDTYDNLADDLGWNYKTGRTKKVDRLYSAFTVAELGEMLPQDIIHIEKGYSKDYEVKLSFGTNFNECWYEADDDTCPDGCGDYYSKSISYNDTSDQDTEADARAKMLIYLIENKLITL